MAEASELPPTALDSLVEQVLNDMNRFDDKQFYHVLQEYAVTHSDEEEVRLVAQHPQVLEAIKHGFQAGRNWEPGEAGGGRPGKIRTISHAIIDYCRSQ